MSGKPIQIRPIFLGDGYHVFVNDVPVVMNASGKGCTIDRDKADLSKMNKKMRAELTDKPAVFPLPTNAMHTAHMIGRYIMKMGDIVEGYTEYTGPNPKQFWSRAYD